MNRINLQIYANSQAEGVKIVVSECNIFWQTKCDIFRIHEIRQIMEKCHLNIS